jgi:hypothetical protein
VSAIADARQELMRKLLLELNYFVDAGLRSRCLLQQKLLIADDHKADADAAGSHIKKPPMPKPNDAPKRPPN